jgi:hypothetical protein
MPSREKSRFTSREPGHHPIRRFEESRGVLSENPPTSFKSILAARTWMAKATFCHHRHRLIFVQHKCREALDSLGAKDLVAFAMLGNFRV